MNAEQERDLFKSLGRIEQHLDTINGGVQDCKRFRSDHPGDCEGKRRPLWKAITTLRVTVGVIVAVPVIAGAVWGVLKALKVL